MIFLISSLIPDNRKFLDFSPTHSAPGQILWWMKIAFGSWNLVRNSLQQRSNGLTLHEESNRSQNQNDFASAVVDDRFHGTTAAATVTGTTTITVTTMTKVTTGNPAAGNRSTTALAAVTTTVAVHRHHDCNTDRTTTVSATTPALGGLAVDHRRRRHWTVGSVCTAKTSRLLFNFRQREKDYTSKTFAPQPPHDKRTENFVQCPTWLIAQMILRQLWPT